VATFAFLYTSVGPGADQATLKESGTSPAL
jgi:hypothetical protein